MQVAVALANAVPALAIEQGYLPKDCILPVDMAKLFVETYGYAPSIIAAEFAENLPASPAPVVPDQQQPKPEAAVDSVLLPSTEAPVEIVKSKEAQYGSMVVCGMVAPASVDVVEVDAKNHCFLENCNQILPNLYLGGWEAVLDSPSLHEHGIRSLVCCMRELEFPDSKFLPDVEYHRVDVEDMGREPIDLFFPEATEFIHNQLLQERPVLIHCKAGVSRSASVLLAYLMEYCGHSLYDAFVLTLRHRPTITPNPGFMETLRDYEKEQCGAATPSICIRKYLEWFQAEGRNPEPDLRPH